MKKLRIFLFAWFLAIQMAAQTGGQFWEEVPTPSFGKLAPIPSNMPDTLYGWSAYVSDGRQNLYRSADDGRSWTRLSLSFFGRAVGDSICIGPGGKFYFLDPVGDTDMSRLWGSTDEGQSWSLLTTDSLKYDVVSETYSGVLIGVRSNNNQLVIGRSVDNGASWVKVFTASKGPLEPFIKVFPGLRMVLGGATNSAYNSFDNGLTWVRMTRKVDKKIVISPTGTIFDYNNTFNRSTDQGHTFSVMELEGDYIGTVSSVSLLPSGRILAMLDIGTTADSLIYSDNEGLNWQYLHPALQVKTLYPEYATLDSTIFGVNGVNLFRSEDGGLHWSFSAEGIHHPSNTHHIIAKGDSILFVNIDNEVWRKGPGLDWRLIAQQGNLSKWGIGDGGQVAYVDEQFTLHYSEDWGDHFSVLVTGAEPLYPWVKIPHGDTLMFIYSIGQGALVSEIGSNNWESIPRAPQFRHPSGRYYTAGNGTEGLLYSDDDASTWQNVTGLPHLQAYNLVVEQHGDILVEFRPSPGQFEWYRSRDNATSWELIRTKPDIFYVGEMRSNEQGHLFVVQNTNLLRSVNGGLVWQVLPLYETASPSFNDLEISSDQRLYIGTKESGIWRTRNPSTEGAYLRGRVVHDADADCSTADIQPSNMGNWVVEAQGADQFYVNTDSAGRYEMFVDTGFYDVTVQMPQHIWWSLCDTVQQAYLPVNGADSTLDFSAIALSECPLITVQVAAPVLRRCFENTVYLQYCNKGVSMAEDAWIDVSLDYYLLFVSSDQPHSDLGNNTIRFFIGDVQEGDCGDFQLIVEVDCDSTVLGQTHCIYAHGFPDTLCTAVPEWSGANIEASVACQDTVLRFELKNTGSAMSELLNYIIIEDDVVMLQGQNQYDPNESMILNLPTNGHTYRIESEQEPGHPFSTRALAFEEGCGGFETLNYINRFSVNGITPSWHRICVENIGSYDPNDKRGFPLGVGDEGRIRPGESIEYMIRFQNTGTDTAFLVFIRDTLAASLDPATLIPGPSSHPYNWHLTGQNELAFVFDNIKLPDSTTNPAGSQGFVTFRISPKTDLPLGTVIHNDAAIYFDFNTPVITNQTTHTIGLDPLPTTGVPELPERENQALVTPNPAEFAAEINWEHTPFSVAILEIYDPLGRLVSRAHPSEKKYSIYKNGLPSGPYCWRLLDARAQVLEGGVLVFK